MDGTGPRERSLHRKDTAVDTHHTTRPIHWMAARRAFGQDLDHQAILGTIKKIAANNLFVAVVGGGWLEVTIDDPGFVRALDRDDLCRYKHKLVVLLNPHYGLIGLAAGTSKPPHRLEVPFGVCRLENGSAVEIVAEAPQPSWLLFRCTARVC